MQCPLNQRTDSPSNAIGQIFLKKMAYELWPGWPPGHHAIVCIDYYRRSLGMAEERTRRFEAGSSQAPQSNAHFLAVKEATAAGSRTLNVKDSVKYSLTFVCVWES